MTTKYTPGREALFAMDTRKFIHFHYLDCQNDERKRKNKNGNNNKKMHINQNTQGHIFYPLLGWVKVFDKVYCAGNTTHNSDRGRSRALPLLYDTSS